MQLDSKQQQMLARAAALVPPSQRDDFERSISGVLDALLVRPPTDAAMRDVLRNVLAARGVAVGAAALLPPPERKFVHDRSANNWRDWRKQKQRPLEAGK